MKKLTLVATLAIIFSYNLIFAQSERSFQTYYGLSEFYQAPPESFKFGLYGFTNPAVTNYLHDNDIMIAAEGNNYDLSDITRWGIFSGGQNNGFGIMKTIGDSGRAIYDYRMSFSGGTKKLSFGLGYGFTGGDKSYFNRSNVISWGAMWRPAKQISVGVHQTYALDRNEYESIASLSVRPIGNYPLALFADVGMFNNENFEEDARWSAGLSWEVIDGVRINSRYFDDERITVGFDLSLGMVGASTVGSLNSDGEISRGTYAIRFGAKDRSAIDIMKSPKYYMVLDLKGGMKYQSPVFWGQSRTLLGTLRKLDLAKNSGLVKGIVINTSGMAINYEMLWEIREKLKELKESGIEIFMFVDRMGIQQYHFASVADKIIMDPLGSLSIEGFAMGRSYYKDMLEKVGVGYQEFRYFKYKSAAEGFSRNDMSEADREQRQALVDGWYELAGKEIAEGRDFSYDKFKELSEKTFIYNYSDAEENDLVDIKGRWTNMTDVMKEIDDNFVKLPEATQDMVFNKPSPYDDDWGGSSNNIAVIYATGVCAMDQGITARKLYKDFEKAAKNKNISAIVLRVDSPGGDAMASDYIAQLVEKYKDKKPIIVSQGFVAASGGYWLSMYGDKIVASPLTITGSIGVIGSYFYDNGIQEDLGINTEVVSAGKFADLGYPFMLPIIPIGIPDKKLNEEELGIIEKSIRGMYKDFVQSVADGRNMDYDEVHEIAQGRVWLGSAGIKNGLIDELGGLDDAIKIAAKEADLEIDKVELIEYPEPQLFDFSSILPSLLGFNINTNENKQFNDLKFRFEHNGRPMPILPMDYIHKDYISE